MTEQARLRRLEHWIARVRLAAIPFAIAEVGFFSSGYPPGYETWAWVTTTAFVAGAIVVYRWNRLDLSFRTQRLLGVAALTFDAGVVGAFTFVYAFEPGQPIRQLLFLPVIEAAMRFGILGVVALSFALLPVLIGSEELRAHRFGPPGFVSDHVSFPFGLQLIVGSIVGRLVHRLQAERANAEARAGEAEGLRDELGRRADLIDAANRCARALSSSLDVDEAVAAFIRELRGLVPFDRVAIVLGDAGEARVLATAGAGADTIFPPGTAVGLTGSLLAEILAQGQLVYREDMRPPRYAEESVFLELGLRCRVAAPLLAGARAIGMVTFVRAEPASFTPSELELISLLGRLVASAVENIRAYDSERRTVEELRRLSALRADFVSLVSHELRSPMAAVIGSARTLQTRWRDLKPEQRDAFLALIADETSRLALLIGDVLDTSRIEAGTFSYSFRDVDVGELVRESVASAGLGQDEIGFEAVVDEPLPRVRGDAERLRQVLANLIENAVKYSPAGETVAVRAKRRDGRVVVDIVDRGPGIAREDQGLIFEKFGRVGVAGNAKPGTGLGLFIARSIAEAHGGALAVESVPGQGSTFTLSLPVEPV